MLLTVALFSGAACFMLLAYAIIAIVALIAERCAAPDGIRVFVSIGKWPLLIDAIGEWVLREACREAVSWPDGTKVAVN